MSRLPFLAACLLLAASPFAAEPDPPALARIVQIRGDADITAHGGGPRSALRGDTLSAGDTLSTGAAGGLQLRMADDALLSLDGASALRLAAPGAAGEMRFELQRGGFRALGGKRPLWVESAHAKLETRPRGSFQCHLENELYCAASNGSITLRNGAGSLTLGLDGDYDFALVATPSSAPLGLLDRPEALGGGPPPAPARPLNRSIVPAPGPNTSPRTLEGGFPAPAPIVITPERKP